MPRPAAAAKGDGAPARGPSEKFVDVQCVGGLYSAQLLVKGRRLNENGRLITLARSHGEGFSSLREAIRSLRKDIEVDAWARSLAYVTNPAAREGEVDPGVYGTGAVPVVPPISATQASSLGQSLRRRWEEQAAQSKDLAAAPLSRAQTIYAGFDRLADAAERFPEGVR